MDADAIARDVLKAMQPGGEGGVLVAFRGTEIVKFAFGFVEESGRPKTANELSAELTGFIDRGGVPIGLAVWQEYPGQRGVFSWNLYPEFEHDPWAQKIVSSFINDFKESLRAGGTKIDEFDS